MFEIFQYALEGGEGGGHGGINETVRVPTFLLFRRLKQVARPCERWHVVLSLIKRGKTIFWVWRAGVRAPRCGSPRRRSGLEPRLLGLHVSLVREIDVLRLCWHARVRVRGRAAHLFMFCSSLTCNVFYSETLAFSENGRWMNLGFFWKIKIAWNEDSWCSPLLPPESRVSASLSKDTLKCLPTGKKFTIIHLLGFNGPLWDYSPWQHMMNLLGDLITSRMT